MMAIRELEGVGFQLCDISIVILVPPPSVGLLHGDMSQGDRDSVISAFKKKEFLTLVATDVAGKTSAGCHVTIT